MPSVETIYNEAIRPLPPSDQLRLAEIIMKRARPDRTEKKSILEILENIRPPKNPRSAAEIDEYLRVERDSWDD